MVLAISRSYNVNRDLLSLCSHRHPCLTLDCIRLSRKDIDMLTLRRREVLTSCQVHPFDVPSSWGQARDDQPPYSTMAAILTTARGWSHTLQPELSVACTESCKGQSLTFRNG